MARSVSAEFKAIWQRKCGTRDRLRIAYKRSYLNAAGTAYVNEAAYSYLYEGDFKGVGPIPMQLDSPLQNIMRTSVVSLRMDNSKNQWVEHAGPPSFFAADAVAANGYRLFKTIFQIQMGYTLSSGTVEWVAIFTGLALKPRITTKDEVEILVASKSLLLEKQDAEATGTVFTLEDCIPATGNGVITEFETTSLGVDHLTRVEVNAAASTEGSSWRFSNANQVAGGDNTGRGKITFAVAPPNTQTVKCSGVKWARNQTLEEAIEALCDVAGITSADRTISPIVFPGALSATKVWTSQVEWQGGTVGEQIDTVTTAGDIKQFVGGFSQSPANSLAPWTLYSGDNAPSVANGYIEKPNAGSFGSRFSRAMTDFYGSWQWDMRMATASAYTGTLEQNIAFAAKQTAGVDPGAEHANKGYWLNFTHSNNTTVTVRLYVHGAALTVLGSFTFAHDSTFHTYKITRSYSGEFKVYMDGVLKITVTDTEHTSEALYFALQLGHNGNVTTTAAIDNIEINSSASQTWISDVHDMTASVVSIGTIVNTANIPATTSITIETQTSTSNGPFNDPDGWVAVGSGGQVLSTKRRYIKVRLTLARTGAVSATASVQDTTLRYSTAAVQLALSNHQGKKCIQAIERYVTLPDYESLFDGDGKFLVRPKTVSSSPVVDLTQENGIIEILDWDPGYDQVVNVGRVRYNDHLAEYDGVDAGEAAPTSETKWGRVVADEDLGDVLLANDVSLASSRAQLRYERGYRPKLKIRARIWFPPWVEVSDVARLSIYDHPLLRQTIIGDPLHSAMSSQFIMAGEAKNVLARSLNMKVLELKPNPDTNVAEALFEEVLS